LYVADAYFGLLRVNLLTGEKNTILSARDKRFSDAILLFTNDLDLDGDLIYFIDSSYEREINEALEEHLEALPRGRLYSYDVKKDKLNLLLSNLYFPNGLQLSPKKDYLLINENSMARIIKLDNFFYYDSV
jgi:sugar lactone lactonase YvrE